MFSGTSPSMSKRRTWSTQMVGLSEATAVSTSPIKSAGFEGVTISSPGVFHIIAWGLWECWAAPPPRTPWL